MAFPDNFINELVERNDIVDVVGSYVRLSKRSGANLFGLCPFHNDRHPSLYVSDDHYHCFACGEHGDVIDLTAKLFERIKESFSIRVFVEYRAVSPGFLYKSSGHQAFPKTGF